MIEWQDTAWTDVGLGGKGSKEALEKLCKAYHPPILEIIRSRRYADAEDLAQTFTMGLLESDFFASADRTRGRFRDYITGALFRFLAHEYRKRHADKRGGGRAPLSFEAATSDERDGWLVDPRTPEDMVLQQRALEILQWARHDLADDYRKLGKYEVYRALVIFLRHDPEPGQYAEIAARFGVSRSAISSNVHRLRQDYNSILGNYLGTIIKPRERPIRPAPAPPEDPQKLATYHWALHIRQTALDRSLDLYRARDKPNRFLHLSPYLEHDPTPDQLTALIPHIEEHTPDDAQKAISRCRWAYRQQVIAIVRNSCRDQVDWVREMVELEEWLGV